MTGPVEASGQLGDLYVAHAPGALRLAYLLCGDQALAEDLVHDAFARVIGRLGHLRDKGAFADYLRRSVVNLTKNHFRRRAIERAWLERERAQPGPAGSPPDLFGADAMRRALVRVPARQRAALVLRFYEDYSEDQIADALGCRPGTVRSLISRGMETLRREYRGEDDE